MSGQIFEYVFSIQPKMLPEKRIFSELRQQSSAPLLRSLSNPSVNGHIITNYIFSILPKIPWEKRYFPDKLSSIPLTIYYSLIRTSINSICDLQHFCICSFKTTSDKLRTAILSCDLRSIFRSMIRIIINSTYDLPRFCICSLDSTHDTLRKKYYPDVLPRNPRTIFNLKN